VTAHRIRIANGDYVSLAIVLFTIFAHNFASFETQLTLKCDVIDEKCRGEIAIAHIVPIQSARVDASMADVPALGLREPDELFELAFAQQ
jgi:hypothetical protein